MTDIVLSANSHHDFNQTFFFVTVSGAAVITLPVLWGPLSIRLLHSIALNIIHLLGVFKGGILNDFVRLPDTRHTQQTRSWYIGFFFFSLTSRRAMTSDSWLIQWRTQEVCFFWEGGGSTNSVEDRGRREQGSGDGSPLVRGSRGSCYLVQEISFHIVKFS